MVMVGRSLLGFQAPINSGDPLLFYIFSIPVLEVKSRSKRTIGRRSEYIYHSMLTAWHADTTPYQAVPSRLSWNLIGARIES